MLLTCYNFFYLLTCVNNVLLDAIKMSYVLFGPLFPAVNLIVP